MSVETPEKTDELDESLVAAEVETAIGDSPAAAETDVQEARRWFEIVDVPEAGFRAFVRLPNDYQHKDIREKAMAAKSRRIRQLKNPSTDAYEVLEFEIEQIAQAEGALENLVHELLMARAHLDRDEVIEDVNEDEKWANIRQDQERFRALQRMPEEERPNDEWVELVQHLADYANAIEKRMTEVQEPRREALTSLGLDALIEKVRERRIDISSRMAFADTYSFWQIYVGTLKIPEGFDPDNVTTETMPHERVFATEDDLRHADSLVLSRIQDAFDTLESALASLTAGNW